MERAQDIEMQQVDHLPLQDRTDPNVHWRAVFDKYDRDHDGRISIQELHNMINSDECSEEIPRHVIRQIMKKSDTDNDGYLDLEEFIVMIHHPELRSHFKHLFQSYIKCVVPQRSGRRVVTEVMDGQYEEEYSCWPPAVCMVIVAIVEFVLFMIDAFLNNTEATGPVATKLIYDPQRRFEPWRYITYMFVHVGSMHLVENLAAQILLGIPLEMVHRWWRVLIIYVAGVVAGSLGTSIADPSKKLAGASGGVYSLIAAHLATLVINWSEIEYAPIQLIIFFAFVGTGVGTAIYNRYYLNSELSIAYVAHFAGALAGLLVGIGVLRNLEVKSWENYLWWVAVVIYCVLMVVAVFINIFYIDHFPPSMH